MPALRATNVYLTITWLGVVTHRRDIEIETEPRKKLDLDWDGVTGAAYRGRTRASDSRVLQQHPRGTQITNVRQLSIVSQEEIDEIGKPFMKCENVKRPISFYGVIKFKLEYLETWAVSCFCC